MFGKLLKYEIKSNSRALLPAYGAGIGGALLLRLISLLLGKIFPAAAVPVEQFLSMPVWVYAAALVVFSVGYVIMRFYRSMVGREAYLTLTLPVSNTMHLCAKYVGGLIFGILGFSAAVLTVVAYTVDKAAVSAWQRTFSDYRAFIGLVVGAVMLLLLYFLMETFLSCTVGGQTKNKAAGSFISYFIINNVMGIVILGIIAVAGLIIRNSNPLWLAELMEKLPLIETNLLALSDFLWAVLGVIAAFTLPASVAEFFAARYLVNKKVNLD